MPAKYIDALPKDSIFHQWLLARSVVETPTSFDLACAMAAFGTAFKRSVWFDQVFWRVYPNPSVLLVAGSGVGKNTAIDGVNQFITQVNLPSVYSKTIEGLTDQIQQLGDPACCIVKAEELSDLVGTKDYQDGMLPGLTDLLDTKDYKDISIKSDKGKRRILHPTVCILAGSTPNWLHSAMPPEAMGGGFYPRFLIVCDNNLKRHVPVVKALPTLEVRAATQAHAEFLEGCASMLKHMIGHGEYTLNPAALHLYSDWYARRLSLFSNIASAYAHRSRDHVLRLAMISALSRCAAELEHDDVAFAIAFMQHIADSLDTALAMPNPESDCARFILGLLPISIANIYREATKVYPLRVVRDAMAILTDSNQFREQDGLFVKQ